MDEQQPEGYLLDPDPRRDHEGVYHCYDCAHTRFFLCVRSLVEAGRLVPVPQAAGRVCAYCHVTAQLRSQAGR